MNSACRNSKSAGFTLIEVMISVALLAVISMGIYQATTKTYELRDSLLREGDFYNGIRMAMGILDRDIEMLYSPVMMAPSAKKTNTQGLAQPPDANDMEQIMGSQQTEFWASATDKTGIRPSRFIGTDNKMSFISVSHMRMYRDAPEAEFAKITYELQNDKRTLDNKDAGNQILVKIENPNAFETERDEKADKARRTYALLRNIRKITYRYHNKEKDRWEPRWDSDSQDFKNTYPDMIEVKIDVQGSARLHFEGTYTFKPEVPINGLDPSS